MQNSQKIVLTLLFFIRLIKGNSLVPIKVSSLCGDWVNYNNEKCLKILHRTGPKTQKDAENACRSLSRNEPLAKLTTIKTREQYNFLILFLNEQKISANVWLGLKHNNTSQQFEWNDGSNLVLSDLVKPNVPGLDYECVQMDKVGVWEVVSCTKQNIAVCEREATWPPGCLQNEQSSKTATGRKQKDCEEKILKSEEKIDILKEATDRTISFLQEIMEKINDLEQNGDQNKTVDSHRYLAEFENHECKKEKQSLKVALNVSKQEIGHLKDANHNLSQEIFELRKANEVSKQAIINLKDAQAKFVQEINNLKVASKEYEDEVTSLKAKNEAAAQNMSSLHRTKAAYEIENRNLKIANNGCQHQISNLKEVNAACKYEMTEMKEANNTCERKLANFHHASSLELRYLNLNPGCSSGSTRNTAVPLLGRRRQNREIEPDEVLFSQFYWSWCDHLGPPDQAVFVPGQCPHCHPFDELKRNWPAEGILALKLQEMACQGKEQDFVWLVSLISSTVLGSLRYYEVQVEKVLKKGCQKKEDLEMTTLVLAGRQDCACPVMLQNETYVIMGSDNFLCGINDEKRYMYRYDFNKRTKVFHIKQISKNYEDDKILQDAFTLFVNRMNDQGCFLTFGDLPFGVKR